MRADVLQRLGLGALDAVKSNPTFPYDTGNLRNNATKVMFLGENMFVIWFDKTVAPYVKWLEEGTREGTYTSKTGKTVKYRGMTKHVGFISERATNDIIAYLGKQFNLQSRVIVENNYGKRFGGK